MFTIKSLRELFRNLDDKSIFLLTYSQTIIIGLRYFSDSTLAGTTHPNKLGNTRKSWKKRDCLGNSPRCFDMGISEQDCIIGVEAGGGGCTH